MFTMLEIESIRGYVYIRVTISNNCSSTSDLFFAFSVAQQKDANFTASLLRGQAAVEYLNRSTVRIASIQGDLLRESGGHGCFWE